MTKDELRREMRALLRTIAPERVEKSRAIYRAVAAHPAFARSQFIAVFDPLAIEPDLSELFLAAEGRCCFPRVSGPNLEFAHAPTTDALVSAKWHPTIREPGAAARLVSPDEIGLILVPGLAFTRDGRRLGRGGGFYDRYLAGLSAPTMKLGVCFHGQLRETLPEEAHDQRVDAVVTERGLFSWLG